jgi:glyoxylase-like metal-dependent hydrolase (beta-lactamase superfamily II)
MSGPSARHSYSSATLTYFIAGPLCIILEKMKQIHYFALILFFISTSCDTKKKEWFVVEKLDSRTFIIKEPKSSQGNSSFLIIGDNEAILFDSGTGENKGTSITHVIDSLTNSRLTLLLSHFHFDHIGNVDEFPIIGIPELSFLRNRLTKDSILHLTHDEVLSESTKSLKISKLFPVENEINLGNRKVTILHTPGHANGSISIIDKENKYIFTGDLVYNGLLLIDDCSEYAESIRKIIENSNSNYRVFG